ncbi:MAG: phosphotransferase, partial [Planctomycetota bacterium]
SEVATATDKVASISCVTLVIDDEPVIARENAIPAIDVVLRQDRFQKFLAERDSNMDSEQLSPTYLRYKPETSCMTKFETRDGKCWGFAVAYSNDSADKLIKAERFVEQATTGNPSQPGSFVDSKSSLVVYRFPNDPALPLLARIISGDNSSGLLDFSGDNSSTQTTVLSYKPLRRCVLAVKDAPSGSTEVLRLYSKSGFEQASRAAKHLMSSRWSEGSRLADSERHQVLRLEWLQGQPLPSLRDKELEQCLHQCGRMLGEIHRYPNPKFGIRTRRELLHSASASANATSQLIPELATRISRIMVQLRTALFRSTPRFTFTHGDFHPGQVLLTSDGVRLLDWDHAINAPAATDLGRCISHLAVDSLVDGSRDWEAKAEVLRSGYQEVAKVNDLDAYVALSLIQMGPYFFRHRKPGWRHKTELLLELAQQKLNDATRTVSSEPAVSGNPAFLSTATSDVAEDWYVDATNETTASIELQRALGTPVEVQQVDLIHSKPGRRALLRFQFNDSTGASRIVLGKTRKKMLDLIAVDIQQQIRRCVANNDKSVLQVASPKGIVPRWNMWLQSVVPGTPLKLDRDQPASTETAHRIGRALAELHGLDVLANRTHSFADESAILVEQLQAVAAKRTKWAAAIERIAAFCTKRLEHHAQNHDESALTMIHRDFHPGQIILDQSKVGFVDFDLAAIGHPLIDVANYIAHLREFSIRKLNDATALAEQEQAFLAGYKSMHNAAISFDLLSDLVLASLARHIAISRRIEERRKSTRHIIRVCEDLIQSSTSAFQIA